MRQRILNANLHHLKLYSIRIALLRGKCIPLRLKKVRSYVRYGVPSISGVRHVAWTLCIQIVKYERCYYSLPSRNTRSDIFPSSPLLCRHDLSAKKDWTKKNLCTPLRDKLQAVFMPRNLPMSEGPPGLHGQRGGRTTLSGIGKCLAYFTTGVPEVTHQVQPLRVIELTTVQGVVNIVWPTRFFGTIFFYPFLSTYQAPVFSWMLNR